MNIAEKYNLIIKDKVKLPSKMNLSLLEFVRNINEKIALENRKLYPDEELLIVLSNAVRLGYNYTKIMDSIDTFEAFANPEVLEDIKYDIKLIMEKNKEKISYV